MTNLAVIGVGDLADYTISGIRRGGWEGDIRLSPRNADMAADLASRCDCVVAESNQAAVDGAEIVMLAVRPAKVEEAMGSITLTSDQTLLSCAAGVSMERLAAAATASGHDGRVVRAMPVNCARDGLSPTIIYPGDEDIMEFFRHCGPVYSAKDEAEFNAGTTLACVYGWFFALYGRIARHAESFGLDPDTARSMTLAMAAGAATRAANAEGKSLKLLTEGIANEGTFTKRGLDLFEERDSLAGWEEAMDLLMDKLRDT